MFHVEQWAQDVRLLRGVIHWLTSWPVIWLTLLPSSLSLFTLCFVGI